MEAQVLQIEQSIKVIHDYEKAASSLVQTNYDFTLEAALG